MPLLSVLLPCERYKPRGTGGKHCMAEGVWSIFLVMMRNETCVTNPNCCGLLVQLTPSPVNVLLLSVLCLAYGLILYLGIGLGNSTPFARKTVSFVVEIISGVLAFRHLVTIVNPPERVNLTWGALLAHEWEEVPLGSLSAWNRATARILLSGSTGSHSSGTEREEQFSTLRDLLPPPPPSSSPGLMK